MLTTVESAKAQSHYYHLQNDTIVGRCPIYFYDWNPDTANSADTLLTVLYSIGTNYNPKLFSASAIRVIGIASSGGIYDEYGQELSDTFYCTQYYTLLKATPNGYVEKARVRYTHDYATHPKRYMELHWGLTATNSWACPAGNPKSRIIPIREYYFDSAVTVTDSFYIGSTAYQYPALYDPNDSLYNSLEVWNVSFNHREVILRSQNGSVVQPCAKKLPARENIVRIREADEPRFPNLTDSLWNHAAAGNDVALIFPIIEIDTTGIPYDTAHFACPIPTKLSLGQRDSTFAIVTWAGHSTDSLWEVSLTSPDGDPDGGIIYNANSTYILVDGLTPDSSYNVYVRSWCRNNDGWYTWSDWSEPFFIDSIPTGAGSGTEGITSIQPHRMSLMPNPAHSTVTVSIDIPVAEATLQILDIQGRKMQTHKMKGQSITLDINSLPTGNYIIRLDSPQLSVCRRLTID